MEKILHLLISCSGLCFLYFGIADPDHWLALTIITGINIIAVFTLLICTGVWFLYLNNKYIAHEHRIIKLSTNNKLSLIWDSIVGFTMTGILYFHEYILTSLACVFAHLVILSLMVKYTRKPKRKVSKTKKHCSSKAEKLKSMLSKGLR